MTMEYFCANFKDVLKTLGLKEENLESPTFIIVAEELRGKLFSEKKDLNGHFANKEYKNGINPSEIKVKIDKDKHTIEFIGESYDNEQKFNGILVYEPESKELIYRENISGYKNDTKYDKVEGNLTFKYDSDGKLYYKKLSGFNHNFYKENGMLHSDHHVDLEESTILSNGLEFRKVIKENSFHSNENRIIFPSADSLINLKGSSKEIMTREAFDVMSVMYSDGDVDVRSYQEIYKAPEKMDSYGSLQRLKFSSSDMVRRGISGISLLTDEEIEKKINNPSDSKKIQDALREMSIGRNQQVQRMLEQAELYEKENQSGISR